MYKFLLYLILLPTSIVFASSDHLHSHDKHKDISIAYKEVNQDKYNIFVGDDGILAPIFAGQYFENKSFAILCEEINFHKLYYIVVGYIYFLKIYQMSILQSLM